MRRVGRIVAVAVIVVTSSVYGCGRDTTQKSTTGAVRVQLPDWAPQDPSPEFLRAAQLLKPLPPEVVQTFAPTQVAGEAWTARFNKIFTASYELFGSLTDDQIQRLWSANRLMIPVSSLTEKQRMALDNWFATWRDAMEGVPDAGRPPFPDMLVVLYKFGAKSDLSNVSVGFDLAGQSVTTKFGIKMPDGSNQLGFGQTFATK